MNEVEILQILSIYNDRAWSHLQFWTSVSFGLLIAAHFAAANVSRSVLVVVLVLYILFTATIIPVIRFETQAIIAGGSQLEMLADEGAKLSLISRAALDYGPLLNDTWYTRIPRQGMVLGLFLVTLFYPIQCYRKRTR